MMSLIQTTGHSDADRLLSFIRDFYNRNCDEHEHRIAIALSGGVDSAVVAKATFEAIGSRAIAITAKSSSVAQRELNHAVQVVELVGIEHQIIETNEFENEAYLRNDSQRCFHCKTELYGHIEQLKLAKDIGAVFNGANLDDKGDYRPGMIAAKNFRVISPLLECEFNKQKVRELALFWKLPIHDKPASPCLSSRVAYGESVDANKLSMIERAECFLHDLDLRELRVRYHSGAHARIEVPVEQISRLVEFKLRSRIVEYFKELGFKFISLDLEGFRSGNLNQLVQLDSDRK